MGKPDKTTDLPLRRAVGQAAAAGRLMAAAAVTGMLQVGPVLTGGDSLVLYEVARQTAIHTRHGHGC